MTDMAALLKAVASKDTRPPWVRWGKGQPFDTCQGWVGWLLKAR